MKNVFRTTLAILLYCTGLLALWRRMWPRKNLLILAYHQVTNGTLDPLNMGVHFKSFDVHMKYLRDHYRVLSFEQAVESLSAHGTVPKNSVVVTFDDGYMDNYTHAYPILKKYHLPAMIFLTVGPLERGESLWQEQIKNCVLHCSLQELSLSLPFASMTMNIQTTWAKRKAVKKLAGLAKNLSLSERNDLLRAMYAKTNSVISKENPAMLLWEQIEEMSKNRISFGSHTVNHPILSKLPLDQVEYELQQSKAKLEERLGKPIQYFAYPNGDADDFNESTIEILKKVGYKCSCTLVPGANSHKNLYHLHRIGVDQQFVGLTNWLTKIIFAAELAGCFDVLFLRKWRNN